MSFPITIGAGRWPNRDIITVVTPGRQTFQIHIDNPESKENPNQGTHTFLNSCPNRNDLAMQCKVSHAVFIPLNDLQQKYAAKHGTQVTENPAYYGSNYDDEAEWGRMGQKEAEGGRRKQKGTEWDRMGQKETEWGRRKQKGTEGGRMGQKEAEGDRMGQNETEWDRMGQNEAEWGRIGTARITKWRFYTWIVSSVYRTWECPWKTWPLPWPQRSRWSLDMSGDRRRHAPVTGNGRCDWRHDLSAGSNSFCTPSWRTFHWDFPLQQYRCSHCSISSNEKRKPTSMHGRKQYWRESSVIRCDWTNIELFSSS